MKRLAMLLVLVGCKVFDPTAEAERQLGPGAICSDERGGYIRCVRNGQPFTCVAGERERRRNVGCFAGSPPTAEAK